METQRVILREDEWDTLHIDSDESESELADYGIDVPIGLIAETERINDEWATHQIVLKGWFESWLPTDEDEAKQIRQLVLFQYRTWEQFAKSATCAHAVVLVEISSFKRNGGTCGECGTFLHRHHVRNDAGEFVATYEIRAD